MLRRVAVFAVVALAGGLALTDPASAANAPIQVDTFADVVNAGDGVTSLREAFDQANANPGDDVIVLTMDPDAGIIDLTGPCPDRDDADNSCGDLDHLDATGALSVEGHDNVLRGDLGTNGFRAIESHGTGLLTLRDLTIEHSGLNIPVGLEGGGVYAAGNVTGIGLILRGNRADAGRGGGVFSDGDISLRLSVVEHNGAHRGSGLFGDHVALAYTRVESNGGNGPGGGVSASAGMEADHTQFIDNSVDGAPGSSCCGDGGGAAVTGDVVLRHTVFHGNTASHNGGGGVLVTGGTLTAEDSTFTDNFGEEAGGAILASEQVVLLRSTVSRNRVRAFRGSGGGGILAFDVAADQSTISDNVVGSSAAGAFSSTGGGIRVGRSATLVNSTVSGNRVVQSPTRDARGGGIFGGVVTLDHTTVIRNEASFGANIRFGALTSEASVIARPRGGGNCVGTGSSTSGGYNVVGRGGNCGLTAATDRRGVASVGLGPLTDIGPTFAHIPSTTALSIIPLSACPLGPDQTGNDEARPAGNRCEAGSVEIL